MKRLVLSLVSFSLAGVLALTGCKKDDNKGGNNDNFDRKALLTNYADNYILPAYADMSAKLTALNTAAATFTAAPDLSSLEALRYSWMEAYSTWQRVDLCEFGPGESVSLRMYMNIFPVTVSKVNANIAAGSYDLETFNNKDAQGFPAIDYLINGLGANDNEILGFYTSDAQAGARKQYLLNVIAKMQEKVSAVRTAWGSYRAGFIENTGTDVSSSLTRMVNGFVLYYERYLRTAKFGLPAGVMTSIARPDLTEAYYRPEFADELAIQSLAAVRQFYEGAHYSGGSDGPGLKDYLAALNTQDDNGVLIANIISTELDEAAASVQNLGQPLSTAVVNNRGAVLTIFDELQEVVPLLKVDMVSALGISITYTDNDGD